jgi:hypothetical protein
MEWRGKGLRSHEIIVISTKFGCRNAVVATRLSQRGCRIYRVCLADSLDQTSVTLGYRKFTFNSLQSIHYFYMIRLGKH